MFIYDLPFKSKFNIKYLLETLNQSHLKYNPRVLPFWNLDGNDMDGSTVKELFTVDYKLFLK